VGPQKNSALAEFFSFMADICCYILYSPSLDKFYTGACQASLSERIAKHNSRFYGNHRFTAAADDWELFLRIDGVDYAHALRIERKIKAMKSKVFIQNLGKYPQISQKITSETNP
jgi:putative endonuclease